MRHDPGHVGSVSPASRKINRRCYVCKRPYTGRHPEGAFACFCWFFHFVKFQNEAADLDFFVTSNQFIYPNESNLPRFLYLLLSDVFFWLTLTSSFCYIFYVLVFEVDGVCNSRRFKSIQRNVRDFLFNGMYSKSSIFSIHHQASFSFHAGRFQRYPAPRVLTILTFLRNGLMLYYMTIAPIQRAGSSYSSSRD